MEYGCIGERLTHSFSAEIHPQLFDYKYELCEIPRDRLDTFMKAKNFKAINVTIPYKQEVIPYLDEIEDTARMIGAVNTIVNRNGKLCGYNTDFSGLYALIKRADIEVLGKKVLVLGSGGTSKTAFAVAESMGADAVYRVSRTGRDGCITYENAVSSHTDADVIINTTPCGMYPKIGEMPIDINQFGNLCGVVDAIYNPLSSAIVCEARKKGIKATGGLYMLVAQAAFAAEKFVDDKVSCEQIEKVYRNMLFKKQNIVLIGMPGCGKSTVGQLISEELGMQFVDSDDEIKNSQNCSIPSIFEAVGQQGFRDIESDVIRRLSSRQNTVIATGGGAVLREINVDLLRENGRIYFIDRPLEALATSDDRPLSNNRADLEKRYNERYDIYRKCADAIIDGSGTIQENMLRIKKDFLNEAFGY